MKKAFISVGEISGDNYGYEIVKRVRNFQWTGITGPKLKKLNVKSIEDIQNISVVGLTEALPKYRKIRNTFKRAVQEIENVDIVIAIDFPGFNLKLLKEAKKRGKKTVYFIPPQVWAWGKGRVKKIVKYTDVLISIFPFEEDIYKPYVSENFRYEYVGHPLLDIVKTTESAESFRKKLNIPKNSKIFGLLAGSRESEVNTLLPILIDTAYLLKKVFPEAFFLIPATENQYINILSKIKKHKNLPIKVITNQEFEYPSYEVMDKSIFSFIASGTATLEATIIGKPFSLIYKVSPITFEIGKRLVSINYLGLPNIIAGDEVVKEFLQDECRPINLANFAIEMLLNKEKYFSLKDNLAKVRKKLGNKGALDRASKIIESL